MHQQPLVQTWFANGNAGLMKKRILFIGEGSEDMGVFLHAQSDTKEQWDLVAVGSREDALKLAGKEPFEVVIASAADGRSELTFLEEFAEKHPKTIRFLFSSRVDDELFMKCVWGTHQLLAKPCKPAILKDRIDRALAADKWLANGRLKDLVAKMRTFPPLPSIYQEVMREIDSPAASAETIGEIICRDLAITAKLIQTVNSALFALSRTVTTPAEAVFILGAEMVKGLVLSVHTFGRMDRVKPLYFTMDKVWHHSLAVGRLARQIARLESSDQNIADAAFTAGLFHDLGKLLLASNFTNVYDGAYSLVIKRQLPLHEVERELFGANHAEVGAYLLALWGLPTSIVEAVALHHEPQRAIGEGFSAVTAVHVADALQYEQQVEKEGFVTVKVDSSYLAGLGIEERLDVWRRYIGEPTVGSSPSDEPKNRVANRPAARGQSRPRQKSPQPEKKTNHRGALVGAGIVGCIVAVVLLWILLAKDQGKPKANPVAVSARESQGEPTQVETAASSASSSEESLVEPIQDPMPIAPNPIAETNSAVSQTNVVDKSAAIQLGGIFYRPSRPSAMINGKLVVKGDKVAGGRIVAIEPTSVTIEIGGTNRVLRLR